MGYSVRSITAATLVMLLTVLIAPQLAGAVPVGVDEILFQDSETIAEYLAGEVDMTFSGSTLSITLTNTSTMRVSEDDAANLLTGIGFYLGGDLFISGGTVLTGGSTLINFPDTFTGTDVSGEWGYDNEPLDSGPFQSMPGGLVVDGEVNTVVGVMEATDEPYLESAFGTPDLDGNGFGGPDYGLLSAAVTDFGNGQEAIQDTAWFDITIGGDWSVLGERDFISMIDRGHVVLSFGSPNRSTAPEPSSLLLFGVGVMGAAMVVRRRKKEPTV